MNDEQPTIDPVTLNVLGNAFLSIASEMGTVMLLSAYSAVVREAKDTSTCLLDAKGGMVAQSPMIPIHMNSLASAFDYLREQFALDEVEPGEAFVMNDPYHAGQHLNDILLFLPAFHEGRLVGFTGSVCHHVDIGGGAPLHTGATELFQEGLVIPPMKVPVDVALKGGLIDQMIAANVRVPDLVLGDFHAQLFACMRGERLLAELAGRYGIDTLASAMSALQDYSERVMRANIAAIPDGLYRGEDFTDGLRPEDPPISIRVSVEIDGDEARVDFSETADQVAGPINAPLASVWSAAYTFFVGLAGGGVAVNAGSYRPVTVKTRKGSILDPNFPAPVRSRMTTCYRALTALKRAFSERDPDLVPACGHDTTTAVCLSRKQPGRIDVHLEIIGGGNGASVHGDGCDGVAQSLSNTGNTPVEALESSMDFVRVGAYELIDGSGGEGLHRGGRGIRRTFEMLEDGVALNVYGDRTMTPPWGAAGGGPGRGSAFHLQRDGESTNLGSMNSTATRKGDVVVVETAGGGGWGERGGRPGGETGR